MQINFFAAAGLWVLLASTCSGHPSAMTSCVLPTPGNSLPGKGNQAMSISSVTDGSGDLCVFHNLPKKVQPCKVYTFTVTSRDSLAQIVSVTEGKLSTPGNGKKKSDTCSVVDAKVNSATYTWKAPSSSSVSTIVFSALCGKSKSVLAAPRVSVSLSSDATLCSQKECIHPHPDTFNPEFDYFMLVMQWPPGVGLTQGMSPELANQHNNFTIHGLWPSRANQDTYPSQCTFPKKFNPQNLPMELRKDLEQNWATFKRGGTNEEFWLHEWSKHGTCSQFSTAEEYFSTTLGWSKARKVKQALFAQFPPSRTEPYQVDAIVNQLGGGVALSCGSGNLLEVTFCFSSNGQIQPCPSSLCHSGCGHTVYILPAAANDEDDVGNQQEIDDLVIVVAILLLFMGYWWKRWCRVRVHEQKEEKQEALIQI